MEIGIEINEPDLRVIGVTHYTSDSGEGIGIFLTTDRWIGNPHIVSECDELPDGTIPFIRRAAERHLKNGEWFDEIGWDE